MRKFRSFLSENIESFISFRKASQVWNDNYEGHMSRFDLYCAQKYPNAMNLTQEILDSWCTQRKGEPNNTCRSRVYPIYQFTDYLIKRNLANVVLPQIPKHTKRNYIPHAYSHDELYRFFQACDNLPNEKNDRVHKARRIIAPVFFRLLYSSGIRTCEARWLKVEEVDLKQGVLNIQRSKGSPHYVVLHESMLALMRRYHNEMYEMHPERIYFFPGRDIKSFLSTTWVSWNFREIWKKCNPSRARAYDLRHNYAVENINEWIGEGFSFDKFVYLSKSMGHYELEGTKYYFHLVPALAEIIDNLTNDSFNEIVPEVDYAESQ